MNPQGKSFLALLFLVISGVSGCATAPNENRNAEGNEAAQEYTDPKDPFESVNREIWEFNWEVLDAYVLRPVTVGYVEVMPQFARTGLSNAAENLEEPGNFFNNMLQGKFAPGMDSLLRFILNSTVGLLGTIDVAEKMGVKRQEENFGEVLGVWGLDTGPYLMIPARGPSDVRSLTGTIVDGMYYPLTILDTNLAIARFLIKAIEARASLIPQEEQLRQAVDDYAFVKNAYFENLQFKVTDGKSGENNLDEEDLEDFEEFESLLEDYEIDAEL
ncbi:MlaA family lipoprotein [Alteromonas sp. ASW11-130]|uniref:MlaA family lipoprotein n=1 Tax=Alteromonas sp. ASW11-130 TaxID=3015775 RepID=UPI0022421614|nr:VacJ family lipoprotein [Alteromonas sp. ASW11-130]